MNDIQIQFQIQIQIQIQISPLKFYYLIKVRKVGDPTVNLASYVILVLFREKDTTASSQKLKVFLNGFFVPGHADPIRESMNGRGFTVGLGVGEDQSGTRRRRQCLCTKYKSVNKVKLCTELKFIFKHTLKPRAELLI
jgi:hypothetical protein